MASELVVVSRPEQHALGTRIDALCVRNDPAHVGELHLVSWKTGTRGLMQKSAYDRAVRHSHLAQLAMEITLLHGTHGVVLHRAQLVYLLQTRTATQRPAYFALELDPNSTKQ